MANKPVKSQGAIALIDTRTTTGISPDTYIFSGNGPGRTVQATVVGTGAVTANVTIEASLDNLNFFSVGTLACTGTNTDTKGSNIVGNWKYMRTNTTAITGTGAEVKIYIGG